MMNSNVRCRAMFSAEDLAPGLVTVNMVSIRHKYRHFRPGGEYRYGELGKAYGWVWHAPAVYEAQSRNFEFRTVSSRGV
jgi:hypothetical protein